MSSVETAVDTRGRKWEKYCDGSYYDLWCVRCVDMPCVFDSPTSFHFQREFDAGVFFDLVQVAW